MAPSTEESGPLLPVSMTYIREGNRDNSDSLIKEDANDRPSRRSGDDSSFKGSAMTKKGAYAAVCYMSCAVLLVMFNKAALSSYNFPSANVITLFQMLSSCSLLYALKRWKMISFSANESSENNFFFLPINTLIRSLPLASTYLLYMLVTMESVRGVNVPIYTTLRRTTVAFTMMMEYFLVGQKYSYSLIGRYAIGASILIVSLFFFSDFGGFSVGVIVLGALIAGAHDLSFDFYGYSVVFSANVSTAIYLATIARVGKSSGLNSFGLMWCNGIICGPVLLLWTIIRGELDMAIKFPYIFSPAFCVVLFFSCMLAFFLNYSIFLNTTLNSAVTQTICGNLKDLFTIGLGWMLFGGLPFDFFNVSGQMLGFVGSGMYAYYKLIGT